MTMFDRATAWVRSVVMRRRLEREMQEEMSAHLAQATERFMARGMPERDACLAAKREFGNIGVVQESARDARGGQWLDNFFTDFKYALRYFGRTPLATLTIILTLGLGIGFSGAVFSVVIGIFTRPAPEVPNDPSLVKIRGISNERPFARQLSYSELTAYAELTDTFESVAAWTSGAVVVDPGSVDLDVMRAAAQFVTPNFFSALGVKPALGRSFEQSRFGDLRPPELTAVVSHTIATDRLGGAEAAVGKHIAVNDVTVTVIGVAPSRFNGALRTGEARMIWLPLSAWRTVMKIDEQMFGNSNVAVFEAFARLRPGVSLANALPAVQVVAARTDAAMKAATGRGWTATADIIRMRGPIDLSKRSGDDMGPLAILFSVLAALVLLVCTATVNALLIGSAVARRYEIAVRLALGASRLRIVRQLLTEIAILAISGGALGMWSLGALIKLTEVAQDGFDVTPHWETTTFTLLFSMLTAALCGLSPALHATRTGLSDVLKDSPTLATTRSKAQRRFVIAEIAIAQPLTVMLAAVMSGVISKTPELPNPDVRDRILIANFEPAGPYAHQSPAMLRDLSRRISGLPGVQSALPVGSSYASEYLSLMAVPDSTEQLIQAPIVAGAYNVPPGYFRAVGTRILRGREFVANDTTLAIPPVIITDSAANVLFKGANPIGQRLFANNRSDNRRTEVEVVGVIGVQYETNTLDFPVEITPIFLPLQGIHAARLLVRTTGPAEMVLPTVTKVVRAEARKLPMRKIGTLAQADRRREAQHGGAITVATSFGALALTLASIGLYALLNITIGQRRREIGIRVALGARIGQVVGMFFLSGLRIALQGLAIGVPLAITGLAILLATTRMRFTDFTIPVLVTLASLAVAALASWLPARRAVRVDPMIALRSE